MDYELKERLLVVGRLLTDLPPGSIQDLERKTKALSILRDIVAPQPEMIPAVKDGINSLERIVGFKLGSDVVDVLNFVYSEGAYQGHATKEEYANQAAVQEAKAAANSIRSARNLGDDIEFFRSGGI